MNSRGPGLLERLIGYSLALVVIGVLLSETARLVQAYAGWIVLGLCVLGLLGIGLKLWSNRRW